MSNTQFPYPVCISFFLLPKKKNNELYFKSEIVLNKNLITLRKTAKKKKKMPDIETILINR